MVAGLLDNRDTESFSKLPGISNIPVLGQLFRTRDVSKGLDELVMVVTPEITLPMSPTDIKPLPDFPNEFLIPVQPVAPPPSRSSAAAATKQTKSHKTKGKRAETSAKRVDPVNNKGESAN